MLFSPYTKRIGFLTLGETLSVKNFRSSLHLFQKRTSMLLEIIEAYSFSSHVRQMHIYKISL